jgi:predicted anti-sigma-YlaC factor YlaD
MSVLPRPLDCREVEHSLGVLVLGVIDPAERPAIEAHLADCSRCAATLAELAPLPGLLHRLDAQEAEASLPSPSPELRQRVVAAGMDDEARRRRPKRLRRVAVSLAAAAAVLGAVVAGSAVVGNQGDRSSRPVVVEGTNPSTQVQAHVQLRAVTTGTQLTLRLGGVAPGERCLLVAVDGTGHREVAASWVAGYAGRAEVTGTTSIDRSQLARLLIVTSAGRTLWDAPVRA